MTNGGFLGKPVSSRRYLIEHSQEQVSDVLNPIAHVEVMQNIPSQEKHAIVPYLSHFLCHQPLTLALRP